MELTFRPKPQGIVLGYLSSALFLLVSFYSLYVGLRSGVGTALALGVIMLIAVLADYAAYRTYKETVLIHEQQLSIERSLLGFTWRVAYPLYRDSVVHSESTLSAYHGGLVSYTRRLRLLGDDAPVSFGVGIGAAEAIRFADTLNSHIKSLPLEPRPDPAPEEVWG